MTSSLTCCSTCSSTHFNFILVISIDPLIFREKKLYPKLLFLHKKHSILDLKVEKEKDGNIYLFTINFNLHLKGD